MPLGRFGKITLSCVCGASLTCSRLAVTVTSLSLFVVAKDYVNYNRLENMRARERMRKSNQGEYPDLYRQKH